MKDIRCIVCRKLFSKEDLKGSKECPNCGYQGLTMIISGDKKIKINWLELRIICAWAEQFALNHADDHSMNAFYSIVKELMKQMPGEDPITMYDKAQVFVGESNELIPKGTTIH